MISSVKLVLFYYEKRVNKGIISVAIIENFYIDLFPRLKKYLTEQRCLTDNFKSSVYGYFDKFDVLNFQPCEVDIELCRGTKVIQT